MDIFSFSKHKYLSDILLYSFLGGVSYFILVKLGNVPLRSQTDIIHLQILTAFLLLFNGIGLSIRYTTERLKDRSTDLLKNRRWFALSAFFAALSLLLVNYGLMVIAKTLIGMSHPFRTQQNGLNMLILVWLIELVIIALSMSNHFYKDLAELYKKAKDLEQANLQARYTALQKQLNPHFLFNSLNVLISEIEYNPDSAIAFTRNLSDTYRYILISQDKKLVSLKEELDFLDTYVNLHRTRLGDCIRVDRSGVSDEMEWRLPPLTLQLLVENVIKHNIISPTHPMTISLQTVHEDKEYWLVISNPVRPKQGVTGTGKGLENLSDRYRLLCQRPVIIRQSPELFIVKVPLII